MDKYIFQFQCTAFGALCDSWIDKTFFYIYDKIVMSVTMIESWLCHAKSTARKVLSGG